MNDDELARELEANINRRVANVAGPPRPEQLLARLEWRNRRQRRWLVGTVVVALIGVAAGAFALGESRSSRSSPRAVAPLDDGTPPIVRSDVARVNPANPKLARAEVARAFHDAFTGTTPVAARDAAVQDGASLHGIQEQMARDAVANGYTGQQLAGTTITVRGVEFIDAAHAVAHFTLSVPDRGDVIVDRVGFAVLDAHRWRVALRTMCDLLSLEGSIGKCPPSLP
jgi:hypothetical protein